MDRPKVSRHPERPTVKTISQRAGVTASTISRALKGDPRRIATYRNQALYGELLHHEAVLCPDHVAD